MGNYNEQKPSDKLDTMIIVFRYRSEHGQQSIFDFQQRIIINSAFIVD